MGLRSVVAALAGMAVVALAGASPAASAVPTGFSDSVFASGLVNPSAMAFAPDGRLFVAQQGGALRIVHSDGTLLATPFVTIPVNSAGERGLLGVAFSPDFATTKHVYVYYTATTPAIHNRISRFTASVADPDVAAAGSEVVILDLNNLSSATIHNGGAMHFGSDGKLYVAVGDNATSSNAQTLANLLGKILRINADGTIPTGNPFYNTASGKNRAIWALGLRNPFTFNVQPNFPSSGRLYINDVGQNAWEEINRGVSGANYGWPTREGEANCSVNPNDAGSPYTCPVYAYANDASTCAITGGAFYHSSTQTFPASYVGKYFFADYCAGWIRVYDPATDAASSFASGINAPVDLQVGRDGALYYLARGAGSVGKIQSALSEPPQITQNPSNTTASVGGSALFTVSASGTPPLTYQWQRGGVDIGGATSASYTFANAQESDDGALYRCVVTNDFGSATSSEAILSVTSNTPPTATILAPEAGALYAGGETIGYSGSADDVEETLAGPAFTWRVDFHHDTHTHPFIADTTGSAAGSFVIPATGETAANVFYRIHLTVTDSGGLSHSTYRDVLPRTANLTLQTSPTGLQLTLDGQPLATPVTFPSVVGVQREIGAPSPQVAGSTTYTFGSWSDGGASSHSIATPSVPTTYMATFDSPLPSGDGLTGTYYDFSNFTGFSVTRVDPVVDFNWGRQSPVTGIGADTFSARWSGQVQPQFTGPYTFYLASDDGARLRVNGQLVVDRWSKGRGSESSGVISLVAGQKYAMQVEYFEDRTNALVRLSWSSAAQPKQVVPQNRLYSQ
jgi:glucose/arabinose dehydrogenase